MLLRGITSESVESLLGEERGDTKNMGRRRKKHKRKTGTGLILVLVLMIFGTVRYARANLDDRRAELLARQQEVEKQLSEENERSSQIEDLSAYVQTKKFIEETAREKLGLVYEDEVIFKSEE